MIESPKSIEPSERTAQTLHVATNYYRSESCDFGYGVLKR
jgi:hypothetical protein